MKKIILLLSLLLVLVGCSSNEEKGSSTLTVSCTLDPHSTILEFVKPILSEDYGVEMDIVVLDDYYIFNRALAAGDVDANYFQHVPFFNGEVESHGYDIVNAAAIHIEPFGIYSKEYTLETIPTGAEVIISNSVSDHGRILRILESFGLIEIKEGVDTLEVTTADIISNPKELKFTEIKPELLVKAYEGGEGDLVAINGNYALQGGLTPIEDSIMLEQANEDNIYVNIIAIKAGTQDQENIKALIEVMNSQEVKDFISSNWSDGAVIPVK